MGDAAEPVRPGADTTPSNDVRVLVISQYRLMLKYASDVGLAFDKEALAAVKAVGPDPERASFAKLLTAQGALAKVVAPATPLSLEATAPAPKGPLATLRRPTLVFWMMVVAVVAGIGFTWTEIDIQQAPPAANSSTQSQTSPGGGANPSASSPAANPTGSTTTPPGTSAPAKSTSQTAPTQSATTNVSAAMVFNWCFAAALGAVFYILFTALQYVNNRTFDPRYNTVYLIRFVLGVLSGLIMAALVGQSSFAKSNTQIMSLGPAVLALLGGFSTEAVYQILQRMVDILVAAVNGNAADAAKAKAKAGQKELLSLANDDSMPPEVKSKVIAAAKRIAG